MIRSTLRLTDAAKILPWIGVSFLFFSIFFLINQSGDQDLIKPLEHRQSSGWFDTVVIDPGHGGMDEGAAAHGLKEKDLTLDLARKLADELQKEGFRTLLTRDADVYVGLSDRVSFANLVPRAIFVSLHCDFSADANAKGIETYRCTEKSGGNPALVSVADSGDPEQTLNRVEQELAQNLCGSATRSLHIDNRGDKKANFFVVRNVFYPAVLVECGFLTNGEEAKRLGLDSYRRQLAHFLAAGISSFRSGLGGDEQKTVLTPAASRQTVASAR